MFPDTLAGLYYKDGRTFRLTEAFTYITSVDPASFGYWVDFKYIPGKGHEITVPAEFITNFASVPRIFWSIIPPVGPLAFPAVVHDYIYTIHPAGRKWADAVFRQACKECGASWFTRWAAWASLRVFGRSAWQELLG